MGSAKPNEELPPRPASFAASSASQNTFLTSLYSYCCLLSGKNTREKCWDPNVAHAVQALLSGHCSVF
jgi:hypothetical protein